MEFTPLKDYEGLYEINKNGDIKATKRQGTDGRVIKPCICKNGYKMVSLFKNGKGKSFNLHRLLAINFLENKDNNPIIDHIDRNRLNNDLSNLRWTTYSVNSENIYCKGCIVKEERKYKESIYTYYRVCYRKERKKRFKTEAEAKIYLNELTSSQIGSPE